MNYMELNENATMTQIATAIAKCRVIISRMNGSIYRLAMIDDKHELEDRLAIRRCFADKSEREAYDTFNKAGLFDPPKMYKWLN